MILNVIIKINDDISDHEIVFRTLIFSPVLVVVMVMIIRINDDFDDH